MKELALINLPYYQPGDSKQMDYLFEGTEPRTRTKMNNLRNHFPSIESRLSRIKGNSITVNMEDEGYRLVVFENILRISKACRPNVRFIYLHPHNPEVTLACELANWLTFELGDWYSWQTSLRSTTFLQAMNYSFATVQPFSGTEISGNSYFFMKLAVNVNVRIALANRRPWWSKAPRISVTMLGQWVASSGTAVATTLLLLYQDWKKVWPSLQRKECGSICLNGSGMHGSCVVFGATLKVRGRGWDWGDMQQFIRLEMRLAQWSTKSVPKILSRIPGLALEV